MAAERTSCRHLKDVIGAAERRLNSLTSWDIRRFQMKRLETVGPKTVNNEMLVLTAVLKSARLWAPLQESYDRLAVCKRGPGKSLTPEQTAKLIRDGQDERSLVCGAVRDRSGLCHRVPGGRNKNAPARRSGTRFRAARYRLAAGKHERPARPHAGFK